MSDNDVDIIIVDTAHGDSKKVFQTVYNTQKRRIFNALKNSNADSVIKFKEVLKKIIDGK